MRLRGKTGLCLGTAIALSPPAQVWAGESTIYTYDALGRLVATSRTGTVNDGEQTTIGYDPAGNRSSYGVTGAGGGTPPPPPPPGPPPPPPPPPPPSPPPPGNQPPVANGDSASVARCGTVTKNVTANDTDPEGHYPLTVTAAVSNGKGNAWVASASSVTFQSTGATGLTTVTYTVADSLGATATGTLTINISTLGQCL